MAIDWEAVAEKGIFGSKKKSSMTRAREQLDLNREAAKLSLIDQKGPFGSLNYTEGPDGRFTATTSLDSAGQSALTGARQAASDRMGMFSRYWGSGMPDFSGDRQRIEDTLYSRHASRLDPQFQDRERSLFSRLEAQGITQGSPAFTKAMDDFNRERRSAYDEARQSSILGGGDEQSRLFGLTSAQRGQEFGEVGSLFNLAHLTNTPQSIGHAGIGAPDYLGLVMAKMQAAAARSAARSSATGQMLGTAAGIGLAG